MSFLFPNCRCNSCTGFINRPCSQEMELKEQYQRQVQLHQKEMQSRVDALVKANTPVVQEDDYSALNRLKREIAELQLKIDITELVDKKKRLEKKLDGLRYPSVIQPDDAVCKTEGFFKKEGNLK